MDTIRRGGSFHRGKIFQKKSAPMFRGGFSAPMNSKVSGGGKEGCVRLRPQARFEAPPPLAAALGAKINPRGLSRTIENLNKGAKIVRPFVQRSM